MQDRQTQNRDQFSRQSTGSAANSIDANKLLDLLEVFFSSYRRDLYADPDRFTMQLGLLMEGLPEDVVRYCVDPRTGIQKEYPSFPPNIGEIGEFIETARRR